MDVQRDLGHSLLQLKPAGIRQLQVQHKTTRRLGPSAGEEFLRGSEGLGVPPHGPDQSLQALPNRTVVVHDGDNRLKLHGMYFVLRPGISEA